jgi:eukaryotic-like serine/threonine-protein kinase
MGSVHLGRLLGAVGYSKIVAIKRLHEQFATDPEFLSMFIDEARLASAISHPNVVSSLDVVVENDELLLIMEYVQGETLAQLSKLARESGAPAASGIFQRVLCDALDGLHAAHTASVGGEPLNIVHRDVSPQNVMVGVNGIARVLDFGIAKARSRSHITRPGRVMGKTSYLSPEQLRGQPLDLRTDIFSAGVVLWESLTHCRLFHAGGGQKTRERLLTAPIPAPSSKNPAIAPKLDGIVLKALQRDPTLRYQSAAEFADALRQVPGEATRAEVGAWVRNTATAALAQRLRALELLEAMDITSIAGVALSAPSLHASVGAQALSKSASVRPPAGADAEPTVASFTSNQTTLSLSPKLRSARRRLAVWGTGFALLPASIAILISVESVRPPAVPVVSSRARPSSASLSATAPVEPLAASAEGIRAQAPVSALPAPGHTPTAPAIAPQSAILVRKQVPSKRSQMSDKLPQRSELAKNCDLPYRTDASGVRRVRFECL